jgi:hypothetical protein
VQPSVADQDLGEPVWVGAVEDEVQMGLASACRRRVNLLVDSDGVVTVLDWSAALIGP